MSAAGRVEEQWDRYRIYVNGQFASAYRKSGRRCRCGHFESTHRWSNGEGTIAVMDQAGPGWSEAPCVICFVDSVHEDFQCRGFEEVSAEIPVPGTVQAILLGCTCPIDRNVGAMARHLPWVYDERCPVHLWVCQAAACVHTAAEFGVPIEFQGRVEEINHTRAGHLFCDHCTSPFIVCSTCEIVYGDWRVDPRIAGWRANDALESVEDLIDLVRLEVDWTCLACSGSQR